MPRAFENLDPARFNMISSSKYLALNVRRLLSVFALLGASWRGEITTQFSLYYPDGLLESLEVKKKKKSNTTNMLSTKLKM